MKFLISALFCSIVLPARGRDDWVFGTINATMPTAMSDHSAARSPSSGIIYLAGGCDAENGNVWSEGAKNFRCGSVTDAFFSFDPETSSFASLPELPRPRYRHSSGVADNKVWIVGGRSLEDALIPEIDVYDIATGTWSTIASLPAEYQVSDQAGFSLDEVYIAGGYDVNYTSVTTVLKIGLNGTFEELAPLNKGRGDVLGVASNDGTKAFVAGGFNSEEFCSPLKTVEAYDFASNTWSFLPEMAEGRSEVVLVENRNHLYTMGGEAPLDFSDCKNETYTISTKTVATDTIEILLDGESEWKLLESFPEEQFRFAAAGIPNDDVIYTFGGQIAFNNSCDCFKTTDGVYIYGKVEDIEAKGGTVLVKDDSAGSIHSWVVALVAGVFGTFTLLA